MAKYWITREGKKIPIKKLSDNHITNILSMLIGKTITCSFIGYERYLKSDLACLLPDIYWDIAAEGRNRLNNHQGEGR